jgi:hypothetical protein
MNYNFWLILLLELWFYEISGFLQFLQFGGLIEDFPKFWIGTWKEPFRNLFSLRKDLRNDISERPDESHYPEG